MMIPSNSLGAETILKYRNPSTRKAMQINPRTGIHERQLLSRRAIQ